MKTFLVSLILALSLAAPSQASWLTDFWCSIGLGCPPPAQSIATKPDATGTSVPAAVPPNGSATGGGAATYAQASQLRDYLNAHLVGQVLAGDDSTQPGQQGVFGIYIPLFTGNDPPGATYKGVKYFYLHYRFDTGADMNVGNAIAKFQSFPGYPAYVVTQLAIDAKTTVTPPAARSPAQARSQLAARRARR